MATVSSASDKLEALASKYGERIQAAIAKAMRDLESEIALALAEKAEWRFDDMAEALARLDGALRQSGAFDAADELRAAAEEMGAIVNELRAVQFTPAQANMLQVALDAKFAGWDALIGSEPAAWLRERLVAQTISPISTRDLVNGLREYLDSELQQYAFTYVNTALSRTVADTWKVAGEAMGATQYEYAGPLDFRTRPFCLQALGGNPYTEAEAKALTNDDGNSAWDYQGGYNCRHYWRPFVDV